MKYPKISIIVPNYNSADTIELCVNSILAQTETDWELILADNGSMDNSLEVIKRMERKDYRIRSILVSERGVSAARNAGLDLARGQFITFIDSDDAVEPDFLENLVSTDADLSLCSYQVDYVDTSGNVTRSVPATLNNFTWETSQGKEILIPTFENGFMHFCWNKMFRRDIIDAHLIRFKPFPVNEDYIFVMEYLSHVNSIIAVGKPLYHWRRTENKVTGVNSLPDNILEIYNHSHLLTRKFYRNNNMADRIAYFTYELLVYKYYDAFDQGRISKKELLNFFNSFANNSLIKSSFNAFKPVTKGAILSHWLIRHGCFKTHYFITQKILKR